MIITGSALYINAEINPHYEKGVQLYNEKKYDEAVEEFKQVLAAEDPGQKKVAQASIASIYMVQGKYNDSVEFFTKALEIDPDYLYANEMIGMVYLGGLRDHGKALPFLLRAEQLKSENNSVYYNLACCYSLMNDVEKAFAYLDKALFYGYRNVENIKSDTDFINLRADSRYKNLTANFSSIIEGDSCISRGDESYSKRDYGKAVKFYLDAITLYSTALWNDSRNMDKLYQTTGSLYDHMQDYDNAGAYYERSLNVRLKLYGENNNATAIMYFSLGNVYEEKRDYASALSLYEKSLKIKTELYGEYHQNLMGIYTNLGSLYASLYNYDKAIFYQQKGLKLVADQFGGKSPQVAYECNNLGRAYQQKGDYKNALDCYGRALQITLDAHGENYSYSAVCYAMLGSLYDVMGDYGRSVTYYEKALKISIAVSGEKTIETAAFYSLLGVSYSQSGKYETAVTYCEKALNIALEIRGEKDIFTANCYFHLGHVYRDSGEYERALSSYGKALNIWREIKGENDLSTAFGYSCLALVYDDMKNYKLAIENHTRALDIGIVLVGADNPDAANAYHNLGWSYWNNGDLPRAIEYLEKSASIIKKFEKNQAAIRIYQNLGSLYVSAGRYRDALGILLSSVETIERVRRFNLSGGTDFTSRNINTFYYALNSCYLLKDMDSMFNISERMRAMGYIERLSINSAIESAGIDPEKGKKLLQLRDDIERLSSMRQKVISEPVSAMNENVKKYHDALLEKVSAELAQAEADFNRLDNEFMKNEKYRMLRDTGVVTIKSAQAFCGKDGAIIEYIIPGKPDKYMKPYAVVITGSSINAVELDPSYNYPGQIEKYREAIKGNNQSETDRLGAELYAKLLEPVNGFINSANIKNLIIVPDGSLAFLPFDSLKTRDNTCLSERYGLTLTPSITVSSMIKNRKYARRDNLMAFGGGIYSVKGESSNRGGSSLRGIVLENADKERLAVKAYNTPMEYYQAQQIGWADLPGTKREVSVINEKIFTKKNTDVYTGRDVSEENLKSLSKSGKLKKYSSIHLACHGYYDAEYPEYSAVVFSEVSGKIKDSKDDGYMSVEETALLDLQAEIVVLSACETGLGRMVSGDGVIGLTRAFQVAGSNRVLVTLWQVSDEATEAFMVSFYAKVKGGMSYRDALVNVKEEFKKSEKFSAPYFWAGFVLYE